LDPSGEGQVSKDELLGGSWPGGILPWSKLTERLNQGHDSATILNHREPRNHAQPAQAEVPTALPSIDLEMIWIYLDGQSAAMLNFPMGASFKSLSHISITVHAIPCLFESEVLDLGHVLGGSRVLDFRVYGLGEPNLWQRSPEASRHVSGQGFAFCTSWVLVRFTKIAVSFATNIIQHLPTKV